MKFLVFNIVVLLSLGYLITGQKNQSVGNWLDALPQKIINSYEDKDFSPLLSQGTQRPSQKEKFIPETKNALAENKVEAKEASENKISGQELKLLIEKTVKESLANQAGKLNRQVEQKLKPEGSDMLVARINSAIHKDQEHKDQEARENPESDEELARAFSEFKKVEGGGSGENQNENVQNVVQEQPTFMSASERRLALSDFIQQMQVVSVEREDFRNMKKGHGTLLLNVLALAIVTGLIIYEKPKSQNKHTPLVEAKKAGTTALSGTNPVTMSTAKMPPMPRHLDNHNESQSSSVKPDLKQREEPNRNNTNLALKLEPLRPNVEKQEKLEKADVLSALKPKLTRQSLGSLSPMAAPVIERSTVKKVGLQPLSPKTAPVIERSTVKKAGLQPVSPKPASTASLPTVSEQKREPENRLLPSSTDISKGMAILREAEKGNALNFELYWPQGQRQAERLYGLLSACYGMQSALLDEQGNLYFPASKRGNLPSGFSPLLHQVGQVLPMLRRKN